MVHQASPGDPTAAYILGVSYMRMGMNVEAIPLIESSLSQVKSAEAYMILGEACWASRIGRRRGTAFQKAIEMDPTLPGIYADLVRALASYGRTGQRQGVLPEGTSPGSWTTSKSIICLANWIVLIGNNADAEKYLDKAIELQPGNPGPAYELSVLAVQNQDYSKAEAILESIVQKAPSFTDAHVLLAQVYSRLHKTQEGTRERAIAAALQKADHDRLASRRRKAQVVVRRQERGSTG